MNFRLSCLTLLLLGAALTAWAQNPPSKEELEAMALEQKILQGRAAGAPVKMPAGRPPGAMPGGFPGGAAPAADDGNQGSVFTRIRSMFFKPGDTNMPVVSTFTSSRDTNPPVKLALPPPSIDWNKSRQQKLAELLQEYRNEKLTPTEYHQKRREILAAP